MSTSEIRRGEIYWTDWHPARGSEQEGRRPSLVIQTDSGNRSDKYPNTIVAALTTRKRDVLTHVSVEPDSENGLTRPSYIMCEQIVTISKDRLKSRIGVLGVEDMNRVSETLKRALDLR